MVNFQRVNLLDARAPNPSVETLLHAFLPHKFIDHTHAAAVLSLVDQPDGEELVAEVYDGAMGLVPYAIPGFGLAKLAAQVYDAKPDVEGLILHKHGIFTFGADAREAYERMIAHVSRAEARLGRAGATCLRPRPCPRRWPRRPRWRRSCAGWWRCSRRGPAGSPRGSSSTSAPVPTSATTSTAPISPTMPSAAW